MRNEFEYTYMLKVCQNLNFMYGIDAWVSSFPSLANVGDAIDKMRMRIVIVRDKTERKPIEVV